MLHATVFFVPSDGKSFGSNMLNQLLSLSRPLFVIDVESTSLDTQTARIVEIAFQQFDSTGLVKEYQTRVNPGVPIPAEATKIHNISDADVAGKPMFKQLAESFARGFKDCDFCGQNVRYDLRVIAAEMQRAGQSWSYVGARIIDSGQLERLAIPRSLSHLHEKYTGAKHDGAHGALSDVRASTTVIVHQLQQHQTLPRDLDNLHAAQWPGWIDGEGKFRFIDGVPCFGQWGKYANKPMRNADNGYWDFILKGTFSADVKALASAAKLGRFPTTQEQS